MKMDKERLEGMIRRLGRLGLLAMLTLLLGVAPSGKVFAKKAYVKGKTVTGGVISASKIPVSYGGKFKKSGAKYKYVYPDGTKAVGWKKIGTKVYYFSSKGNTYKGKRKLGKYTYCFTKKGVLRTGWITVDGKKFYFRKNKNGAAAKGYTKIGSNYYYFDKNCVRITGWVYRKEQYIYFKTSGKQAFGWVTINNSRYYLDPDNGGARVTGKKTIDGRDYYFDSEGALVSVDRPDFASMDTTPSGGDSFYVDSSGNRLQRSTIKRLLQTAMKPVGSTMYVWGGGWSPAGTADTVTRSIGVHWQWKNYFDQQNASYNYKNMPSYNDNGLDCSGYVGWVIYNTFNRSSGHSGYVMGAEFQARTFANYGWGSYTPYYSVGDYRPGDIMSLAEGHVYIVLGPCSDGSVVLLHSSPNGVMISGTTTRSGSKDSEAIALSDRYMRYYYPAAYQKFNTTERHIWRDEEYLTSYSRMRWYLDGPSSMLSDPDGYASMSAAQVLRDLFGE